MNIDEMHQEPKKNEFSDKEISEMWPQSRGELAGFALAMSRGNATITAVQIRMAIQLADEAFKERNRYVPTS